MSKLFRQSLARGLLNTTAFSVVAIAPGLALAQAAGSALAASGAQATAQIEEVVVTAQKRTEDLQTVPISAQVVSGRTLAATNQNSLADLSQTTPGIQVDPGPGTTKLFIRGIGSGTNSAFDQSVGTFVDDIYHGRSKADLSSFLDVDRIEILKGPQSTYFGNNAIAGALNIVTNKSDQTFNGAARVLYGSYGEYAAEAAVGVPIGDGFGLRIAGIANGQSGWIKNVNTGLTEPQSNNLTGRLTLTYNAPNDDFDAALKIEGGHMKQRGDLYDQVADCPPQSVYGPAAGFCALALADHVPTNLGLRENADNAGENVLLNTNEYVLTANYRKWGHTFSSVTGYYDYNYNQNLDATGTPATIPTPANGPGGGINAQLPEAYHQFSQEFRVTSPADQPIEYLVGVYYQTDHLDDDSTEGLFFLNSLLAAKVPPLAAYLPLGQQINYGQNEDSYAIFGALTWNITNKLKITGGLRGTWVDKSYKWNEYYGTVSQAYGGPVVRLPSVLAGIPGLLGVGVPGSQVGSRRDSAAIPSARVQYQVDPEAMAYFSYAAGVKAGGFNGGYNNAPGCLTATTTSATCPVVGGAAINYAPERVNAYEVGLKSKGFDNQVLFNLAAFYSDYSNLQVAQDRPTPTGFIGIVSNAADSVSEGVELQAQWVINEHFQLSTADTYLDAHFVNYQNVQPNEYQRFVLKEAVQNLSGRPTDLAPKWSGNVAGTFFADVAGGYHLTAELAGIYATSYFLEGSDDPLIEQHPYFRFDARLSIESPDDRWGFDIIGKNLTNQKIRTFGSPQAQSPGSIITTLQEPLNVAAQLRYRW